MQGAKVKNEQCKSMTRHGVYLKSVLVRGCEERIHNINNLVDHLKNNILTMERQTKSS